MCMKVTEELRRLIRNIYTQLECRSVCLSSETEYSSTTGHQRAVQRLDPTNVWTMLIKWVKRVLCPHVVTRLMTSSSSCIHVWPSHTRLAAAFRRTWRRHEGVCSDSHVNNGWMHLFHTYTEHKWALISKVIILKKLSFIIFVILASATPVSQSSSVLLDFITKHLFIYPLSLRYKVFALIRWEK